MNISAHFIQRPVATTLLMLALVLFGWIGWRALPVSSLPQVDYPMIQVFTFQSGAAPDLISRRVTAVLEQELGKISGVQQMSSSSAHGVSVINLQFGLQENMMLAEQNIQAALNTVKLPNDLKAPPIYHKVNPADAPVMTLAITSSSLPLEQVYSLIDVRLVQKLAQVSGVGLVTISGGKKPAIRIAVNSQALASANISLEQVRQAIQTATTIGPKGSLTGKYRTTSIVSNDQLVSAEEYKKIILAWQDNQVLRLGDVADISMGAEDNYAFSEFNQQSAILLNIQRQPGANVIDVAREIKKLLPKVQNTLPASIEVTIASDRTTNIKASVDDVQKELIFAVFLVVLVTFLFLRRATLAVIPSVAIPLSLLGTLAIMYLCGFSLNNLTLMALTIATGFVIDDAVVMMENIVRYRESGDNALQAALKGAKEISFTLISLTISLLAVLIPLFFMGDLVGRLFHEFSLTIATAIVVSLFVSLTLTPMMSAKLLVNFKSTAALNSSKLSLWDKLLASYAKSLRWTLGRPKLMLISLIVTMLLTVVFYWLVPKGFFPTQDNGTIQATLQLPSNASFNQALKKQQQVVEQVLQQPDVHNVTAIIGVDGFANDSINQVQLQINLKTYQQRKNSIASIMQQIQQKTANIAGITLWLQLLQELSVDTKLAKLQYQLTLSSSTLEQLYNNMPSVMHKLQQLPQIKAITSDLQPRATSVELSIDRDKALYYGVKISDVLQILQNSFTQRQITTLYTDSDQYQVILELADKHIPSAQLWDNLFVNGTQKVVPLSSVVHIKPTQEPVFIARLNQLASATISFNVAPNYSLGQAVAAVENSLQHMQLPNDVTYQWQGAAQAFHSSLTNTIWLLIAAIVAMYIVLGILYESYIHPLTILSTLPSALVGALLALLVFKVPLDLIAVIGLILLLGLVKKNGVMLVDFALHAQRQQHLSPQQAIYQAALLRFRPILMTTVAAIVGAVPLLLSFGVGAEMRRPLGLVMVAGLLVSQLLTLYTTPSIYLWFDKFSSKRNSGNKD